MAPARTLRQTSVRQPRRGPPKPGAAGPAPCGWGLPGFRARRHRRPEPAISMASARRTARAAQRKADALRGTRRTGGTQGAIMEGVITGYSRKPSRCKGAEARKSDLIQAYSHLGDRSLRIPTKHEHYKGHNKGLARYVCAHACVCTCVWACARVCFAVLSACGGTPTALADVRRSSRGRRSRPALAETE